MNQLVDSQKELLEVIRASNESSSSHHPSPGNISGTTTLFVQPNYPRDPGTVSWTALGHDDSILEPGQSDIDSGAALEQLQRQLPNNTETSPSVRSIDGNPAALRWFGLLASDARREATATAEHEAELGGCFLHDEAFEDGTALQKATRIVDDCPEAIEGRGDCGMSPAYNSEAPTLTQDKHLWQAESAIQLLPSERSHFENFVRQIGPWVSFRK